MSKREWHKPAWQIRLSWAVARGIMLFGFAMLAHAFWFTAS